VRTGFASERICASTYLYYRARHPSANVRGGRGWRVYFSLRIASLNRRGLQYRVHVQAAPIESIELQDRSSLSDDGLRNAAGEVLAKQNQVAPMRICRL